MISADEQPKAVQTDAACEGKMEAQEASPKGQPPLKEPPPLEVPTREAPFGRAGSWGARFFPQRRPTKDGESERRGYRSEASQVLPSRVLAKKFRASYESYETLLEAVKKAPENSEGKTNLTERIKAARAELDQITKVESQLLTAINHRHSLISAHRCEVSPMNPYGSRAAAKFLDARTAQYIGSSPFVKGDDTWIEAYREDLQKKVITALKTGREIFRDIHTRIGKKLTPRAYININYESAAKGIIDTWLDEIQTDLNHMEAVKAGAYARKPGGGFGALFR